MRKKNEKWNIETLKDGKVYGNFREAVTKKLGKNNNTDNVKKEWIAIKEEMLRRFSK